MSKALENLSPVAHTAQERLIAHLHYDGVSQQQISYAANAPRHQVSRTLSALRERTRVLSEGTRVELTRSLAGPLRGTLGRLVSAKDVQRIGMEVRSACKEWYWVRMDWSGREEFHRRSAFRVLPEEE